MGVRAVGVGLSVEVREGVEIHLKKMFNGNHHRFTANRICPYTS